ncbi:hypothetical protein QQP08_014904 [Theobroma cacao]|nr:hypothetical protein QQP08_014904 [Theobroma cacao]
MAKLVAAFLLALIAFSMLQTMVMASHGHGGHHYDQKHYGPGSLKSSRVIQLIRCLVGNEKSKIFFFEAKEK